VLSSGSRPHEPQAVHAPVFGFPQWMQTAFIARKGFLLPDDE
jgi:hypothetical protein